MYFIFFLSKETVGKKKHLFESIKVSYLWQREYIAGAVKTWIYSQSHLPQCVCLQHVMDLRHTRRSIAVDGELARGMQHSSH